MADDRPGQRQCATRYPKSPYKWNQGKNGDALVTIERGTHKGKKGVVQKCGFESSGRDHGEHMVYLIKLNGSDAKVVVWSSDTAIVVDELAQPGPSHSPTIMVAGSGARWCMVVYGGVSLC